jgi:hypothetical protein
MMRQLPVIRRLIAVVSLLGICLALGATNTGPTRAFPHLSTSADAATLARPAPPPGGKIYGPYKNSFVDPEGNYCESIKNNFIKQGAVPPGWKIACFLGDDGQWYIAIWPPQVQQQSNLYIYPGGYLISLTVQLVMQDDGNAVLYDNHTRRALWATHTVGSGSYLRMQPDGNLVVYNWNNAAVWAANTCCWSGNYMDIQDDGNLVIYTWFGLALWATGTSR